EGEVTYPTMESTQRFAQQVTISHDGRPFLLHESRSWLLDENGEVTKLAARETGWWRPQPDDTIELLLAHSTGIIEMFYGKATKQNSWELSTDAVVRTSSAKEVTGARRLYGLVQGGDLGFVEERAMVGHPMQPHVSSVLKGIIGCTTSRGHTGRRRRSEGAPGVGARAGASPRGIASARSCSTARV